MNKFGTLTNHSRHVNDSKNLSTPFDTQQNEVMNASISKYAPKNENVWYDYLTHQSCFDFRRY